MPYTKQLTVEEHRALAAELYKVHDIYSKAAELIFQRYPKHHKLSEAIYRAWRTGAPVDDLRNMLDNEWYRTTAERSPYYGRKEEGENG